MTAVVPAPRARLRTLRVNWVGVAVTTLLAVVAGALYTLAQPVLADAGVPSSGRPAVNLAVALVVGLAIGLAYALETDERREDASAGEARALADRFDLRLLAVMARPPQLLGDAKQLRSGVVGASGGDARVVAVTCPRASDADPTVARSLAAGAAAEGGPVVLVVGDPRRPGVEAPGDAVREVDLADFLAGEEDAAGALEPSRVRSLLRLLAEDAVVVLDAPPLLGNSLGAVLAAAADGAVLVVSEGTSTDEDLRAALDVLREAGGRPLGLVTT